MSKNQLVLNGGSATDKRVHVRGASQPLAIEGDTTLDLDSVISSFMERFDDFESNFREQSKELSVVGTHCGEDTLTSLRMRAGLTQTELGKAIGQQQSNISNYESGQRLLEISRKTMRRLCEVLGCDMNVLDAAIENTCAMTARHEDVCEPLLNNNTLKSAA